MTPRVKDDVNTDNIGIGVNTRGDASPPEITVRGRQCYSSPRFWPLKTWKTAKFSPKIHQNPIFSGLCPKPRWGSLQRSPRPLSLLPLPKNPTPTLMLRASALRASLRPPTFWTVVTPMIIVQKTVTRTLPPQDTSALDRRKVGTLRTKNNSDETQHHRWFGLNLDLVPKCLGTSVPGPYIVSSGHYGDPAWTLRHQFCGAEVSWRKCSAPQTTEHIPLLFSVIVFKCVANVNVAVVCCCDNSL